MHTSQADVIEMQRRERAEDMAVAEYKMNRDAWGAAVKLAKNTEWNSSKGGRVRIALGFNGIEWSVWALFTGTHELAPVSKSFTDEAVARSWANTVWARF